MKQALVALLIMLAPMSTLAQKNVFYTDLGISLARLYPGASVTYNYNLIRFVGIGAGIQAYDFHATEANYQLIPAVYGELRFNIRPRKRNQFFVSLDIGVNFYKHNDTQWQSDTSVYTVKNNNGTYEGLGLGYAWQMKKTDYKYYISLKIISNTYNAAAYSIISGKQHTEWLGDATLVVSFGFKF